MKMKRCSKGCVLFSLRNERSVQAVLTLCEGFSATSALLRHELAYVLGQMQNPAALPSLIEIGR